MKKNVKASLQAHQLLHWDMQGEKIYLKENVS